MYASISATFSLSATIIYRPTTFQTSYFSTSFVSFLKEHPRFYVQYNPDLVTINIVYNPDLGWYARMPLRVDTLDRLLWRVVTVFDREIAQALAVLQVAVIVLGRPFVLFEYSTRARPEPARAFFSSFLECSSSKFFDREIAQALAVLQVTVIVLLVVILY